MLAEFWIQRSKGPSWVCVFWGTLALYRHRNCAAVVLPAALFREDQEWCPTALSVLDAHEEVAHSSTNTLVPKVIQ